MKDESKVLICVASFIAAAGQEAALKNALLAMLEPTRAEAGCLSYNLHQSLENPALFTMIEHFLDQAAFDLHNQQPYLLALKEQLPALTCSVSVQTYKTCG